MRFTVFSLYSSSHAATEVDVFTEMPVDFPSAYRHARWFELAPELSAPFVGLLRLKRAAGPSQDVLDIEKLSALRDRPGAAA